MRAALVGSSRRRWTRPNASPTVSDDPHIDTDARVADSRTSPGSGSDRRPNAPPRRHWVLAAAGALTIAGIAGAGLALTASPTRPARTVPRSAPSPPVPSELAAIKPRPVIYVQAGHEPPGEPGYLAQTGASGGPFGSEEAFNIRLAAALEADLRSAGVIVYHTPAKVTPWGARGAVFISVHFDQVGGSARIGYAVDGLGRGENSYHGQGAGTASPVPYRDSAPHRHATAVTAAVQA